MSVVVARYTEDISWLLPITDQCIVYNKGPDDLDPRFKTVKTENIGRESHTYLKYIVDNYENLPEKMFFVQGRVSDHPDTFKRQDPVEYIKLALDKEIPNGSASANYQIAQVPKDFKLTEWSGGPTVDSGMTFQEWFETNIGITWQPVMRVYWCANFGVHRQMVWTRPKVFYEKLLAQVQTVHPEVAHFLERSWAYVFFGHLLLLDPTIAVKGT